MANDNNALYRYSKRTLSVINRVFNPYYIGCNLLFTPDNEHYPKAPPSVVAKFVSEKLGLVPLPPWAGFAYGTGVGLAILLIGLVPPLAVLGLLAAACFATPVNPMASFYMAMCILISPVAAPLLSLAYFGENIYRCVMEGQAEVTEQLANAKDSSNSTPTPEELIKPMTSLQPNKSILKQPGSSKRKSVNSVTFDLTDVSLDSSGRVNDNTRKVLEESKSLKP